MYTELVLIGVIATLSFLLYLQSQLHAKHVDDLIKAIIAKTAQELVDLKRVEKLVPEAPTLPEEISMTELEDEAWMKVIEKGSE